MVVVAVGLLVALLVLSVPVAAAMGILGLVLGELYGFLPVTRVLGEMSWRVSTNFMLLSIPLFVLLGEIMLRTRIGERMYSAMVPWLSWLPGGLMHSNIGACTLFAATSGSSAATAATIGTLAIGELPKYGYNERLFLGSLAAGGTLGILIPPSINLIVYGVITETSIPSLYLAAVIPGLLLSLLFMLTILIGCLARPEWGGQRIEVDWNARIRALPDLVPPLVIFALVVGSIYAGLATPTEAAALGVIAALALAVWNRTLTWRVLRDSAEGTMRTTAIIMAIILAAYFLNFVLGSIGLTDQVNKMVINLNLSPTALIVAVIVFYLILGMFMETLSMMLATVPVITPIVVAAGFDPVWFGVVIVLLVEAAMITPPVGMNLFIIQGIRRRGGVVDVIVGTLPFVVTLVVMLALMVAFPQLALWLPKATG